MCEQLLTCQTLSSTKLISHLHFKAEERCIETPNPSLSSGFCRPDAWRASCRAEGGAFILVSHALKIAEGGTHVNMIRSYLNFNGEQMKGVGIPFGFQQECVRIGTMPDFY